MKGVGNQQDYGLRIYDPRLGKFLSVDPIAKRFPELSPYQFASNCPLESTDLDGLEQLSKIVNHINVNDAPSGRGNMKDGQPWKNPITGENIIVGETEVVNETMNPISPYVQHNEIQYRVQASGAVQVTSRTYLQVTKHTVVTQKVSTAMNGNPFLKKEEVPAIMESVKQYVKDLQKNEIVAGVNIIISDAGDQSKKELRQFVKTLKAEIKKAYNIDAKVSTAQSYTKQGTDEKTGKPKTESESGVQVMITTNEVKYEDGPKPVK